MKNSRKSKQFALTSQRGGLKKGNGTSHDHARKEFFRKAFALKLAGKTDQEIYEILTEGEKND